MSSAEDLNTTSLSSSISNMTPPQSDSNFTRDRAFWLSYAAVIVATFLSAIDLTSVATALPTVTHDLNGGDTFVWIGSAYALSNTAFLPLSGTLADTFGRRPIMLGSILFFTVGSALAGAAQNMNMLIAARTIQGVGGGGIINMSEIIVSDIVPLAQRGAYQGFLILVWSFAAAIGPPFGGSLAQRASWRWIFYINLPLTGIAFFVLFFLRVKTPPGTIREKLAKVDWFGNLIVIAGTTLANVGLAFAGIQFLWGSAQVLAPLILGMALFVLFIIYEAFIPNYPTIPWSILSNRTTATAYFGTLIHGITSIGIIYYLPVYFQSVLGASPIRSGLDFLVTTLVIPPFAMLCGVSVQVFRRYVPVNIIGWSITIVGFGLLSLLEVGSSTGRWVGLQIVAAMGTGIIFAATIFPILAPLPIDKNAPASAKCESST